MTSPLLADRVQETTTTTGTGTITLSGATTGCRTFNSAFSNGDVVYYVIDDGAGNWEVGSGTVGTGTLTRSTVYSSSNAGSLVVFGVGSKTVYCDASANVFPSGNIVGTSDTQTLTNKTLTNPTINGFTGNTSVINIGSGQLYKDASGNVGIGTSSPGAKLEVNGNVILGQEVYRNSATNLLRLAGGSAAATGAGISLFGESHATLPNTLSFFNSGSERMRLDSSGNLGLGVTPSANCGGRSLNVGNAGTGAFAAVSLGGAGGDYGGVGYNLGWQTTTGQYKYLQTDTSSWIQFANGGFKFFTAPSGTSGTAISFTQAMTLDASGNLVVGGTASSGDRIYAIGYIRASSGFKVDGGTWVDAPAAESMRFVTSSTERARIDSSGNFFIEVTATTASAANTFIDTATTPAGQVKRSTSSAKYKNSITDAIHGLAEVLKLRPVTYKGNNDGDTVFGGLIAEEVHGVGLTEFVMYDKEGQPDALAYGNMVSLAFKAIQELSAELNELKQKVH